MNKFKFIQLCACFVGCVGLLGMAGWIFDIGWLKSILPMWVTMKFITALSFLLSAIILYYIVEIKKGVLGIAQTILPLAILMLLIPMSILLLSNIFNLQMGIERLFIIEDPGAVMTAVIGRPAILTMGSFILIAIAGLQVTYKHKTGRQGISFIGWTIAIIGGLAVLGFIFNMPILYYYIKGFSTAMALHTAILFVIIGGCLIMLGKD